MRGLACVSCLVSIGREWNQAENAAGGGGDFLFATHCEAPAWRANDRSIQRRHTCRTVHRQTSCIIIKASQTGGKVDFVVWLLLSFIVLYVQKKR